ncbi:MAG: GNAT family N-acetyltransferase [Alphaproteobacteria bacterium]|jgi:ribosomal protein S18 acetylase RimI-like enzyme|uniref:GNAT family N-acetyltransferase n=1 Tax=Methyloceanibacter sp. TaxID=1965321 RepID=UPI003567C180
MAAAPTLRPATLADASALAVLVDIAGEGIPTGFWQELAGPGHSVLEVGRDRARREEGGFSYRHATIAEIGGEVVAGLIVYPLDDPYDLTLDDVPAHVHPLLRLEAQAPGSWYVNVLTTFQEFRGQGIGRALLEVAEKRAYAAGASTMSIIVGSWNEGAERLYQRAGYERIASEPAILPAGFPQSGDWLLLTKPVAP